MRRSAVLAVLVCAASPALASAHGRAAIPPTAVMSQAGSLMSCPGDPIRADRAITGTFTTEQMGSYVLVPFDVPPGTTSVRVKYCFDQPETPVSGQLKHTLDLGLYEARRGALWGEAEFRGWGGSSHPDVTISPEGFSAEEQYLDKPKGHVPGKTTRGYLPGPIPAGTWAAELGVAAVVPQSQGDLDGQVAWRVEIELSSDPAHADEPYVPAPYDETPARREAGWYAGDMHTHAEHSSLGDATNREVFDYAFGPAQLDFITLSDYVTSSGWGEIGRLQAAYPGKLVARSAEVITYRGHLNNHVSARYVDYRTGPVLERAEDGTLVERRAARAPSELLERIHAQGGFTQVNHPTIFPSEVPGFANLCRGCPWDYSDADTDWSRVDAYEVHTGPPGNDAGSNPFTLTAIDEYDRLRRAGHWVAAVGVSDSHNAGRTPNAVTQAPIGTGRTVVRAPELSEEGLRYGIQRGHAYVKVFAGAPDLRLEATDESGRSAIMGDGLAGERAQLVAQVLGGSSRDTLLVLRDGDVIASVPVSGAEFRHERTISGAGDYRIQVMRGDTVQSLTTPIRLGAEHPPVAPVRSRPRRPSLGPAGTRPRLRVRATPRRTRAGRRGIRFRVTTEAGAPVARARIWLAGARARTNPSGRAVIRKRFVRPGRRRALVTRRGYRSARVVIRVTRRR